MADSQIPNNPQPGMPNYPAYYYQKPRRKSNWWVPVVIIGAVLLLIVILIIAFFSMIGSTFEKQTVEVKSNTVLYMTMNNVSEYERSNPFSMFTGGVDKASFFEMLKAVEKAKDDNNIKGIFLDISGAMTMSPVKAAELSNKIRNFKQSGKFVYAFVETGSESDYMNILPADSIFMSKEGMLEMNGFGASAMFFKGLFNKFGIDFYVQQFEDFKSAGESFSRTKFSDSARKEIQVMIDDKMDTFLAAVKEYRRLEPSFTRAALNRGIYTADSLLALGFIDRIASKNEVKDMIKNKLDKSNKSKLNLLSISKYVASNPPMKGKTAPTNKQIAIIYGSGAINSGKTSSPFGDTKQILSGEFIEYLKKARDDKDIKAIILRIDSPGGSVIASDEIWEEIVKTRKVKPVYASMSDVAASGGYYMAMACDTIIAHPQTITGSIGVILMINNMSGALSKLDITIDTISTGKSSYFMNPMMPFREEDKKQLKDLSFEVYKRFVSKAALSRGKSFDEMRSLAKGRVWLGKDAYKYGLVDMLGGLEDAVDLAKARIGVTKDTKVILKTFPGKEEDIKSILRIFGVEDELEGSEASVQSFAKALGISNTQMVEFWALLPDELRSQTSYALSLLNISKKEKAAVALPYYYNIR